MTRANSATISSRICFTGFTLSIRPATCPESAIEASGQSPKLVQGSLENFKITHPADFALADRLLRTREC